jgi:sucrose-phosphate synthase
MGRNADTGGQIRYVLELAKTLADHPKVEAVDLFTRRVRDKNYSDDYTRDIEALGPNCRIVRIPCGPGKYIRKERLWPFLDDFIDGMIAFTRRQGMMPSVVHGHYADAGYVASEVAASFGVPFVFTAHSLGKPKLDYLLREGWSEEKADQELAISHRIQVEQHCLSIADLVVTSTRHERDSQYADYHKNESLPIRVIPPGTDLDRFFPYYDYEIGHANVDERFKQARVRMSNELSRFHFQQDKPLILALCRPDRRKNIGALIDAYGQSNELQAIANLAVFAGIRDNIEQLPDNEQQVLTDMLLSMDRYNLYGKMAIPKRHDSEFEVPELYRLAASSGGVFVNTAFIELFGLTAIESSAVGLPFVATQNGGPQDIVANCKCGELIDVADREQLTSSIVQLLTDRKKWDAFSNNGINKVREQYTWQAHVESFVDAVAEIIGGNPKHTERLPTPPTGRRMGEVEDLLITDIDNTLLGDDDALRQLCDFLHEHRGRIGFGVASGRSLSLIEEVLRDYGIEQLDVAISSVGTEIYYGPNFAPDKGWASHIRHKWQPERIRQAIDALDFVSLQVGESAQRDFKISYTIDDSVDVAWAESRIRQRLDEAKVAYTLIVSHGVFVDVLPFRASKGKAVRFLANKWNIPLERIATAGDSGNDADMLVGNTAGIVVGNHDAELAGLRELKRNRIYFATAHSAAGILEGLRYYGMINDCEHAEAV